MGVKLGQVERERFMVRPFIIGELYVCVITDTFVYYFKCREPMFTDKLHDEFIILSAITFCILTFNVFLTFT